MADDTQNNTTNTQNQNTNSAPPAYDWRTAIPAELKDEPSLQAIGDVPSLIKGYVHAQKAIGSDKITKPSKHATPDDWKQTFRALGVPDEKDYKIDLADEEKSTVDEKFQQFYTKLAAQEQLFPDKAKKVLLESVKFLKQSEVDRQNASKLEQQKAIEGLKTEWGAAYDIKTQQANLAFKTFGKDVPELEKFLVSSGLGNNPAVIKMFAAVGETLKEGKIINSTPDNTGVMTPKSAQQKINEIMGRSMDDPYYNANHPNHKAAVEEMRDLFKMANPDQGQ